jgi:hypothetical protein
LLVVVFLLLVFSLRFFFFFLTLLPLQRSARKNPATAKKLEREPGTLIPVQVSIDVSIQKPKAKSLGFGLWVLALECNQEDSPTKGA